MQAEREWTHSRTSACALAPGAFVSYLPQRTYARKSASDSPLQRRFALQQHMHLTTMGT